MNRKVVNNLSDMQTSHSIENKPNIFTPIAWGAFFIILFFGVFGYWATIAPLESAAIAPGIVSPDSKRKSIQHLEGGIVAAILVEEGQTVNAGDVLLRLDETQQKASLDLLTTRLLAAQALNARLIAERDNKTEITFPQSVIQKQDNKDVAEMIKGQTNIFDARRQSLNGQIAIMEQKIKQIEEEVQGMNNLAASQNEQYRLIQDEIESNLKLFDKGLSGKSRLRELQRELAVISGERSQNMATIARSKQNIGEAYLQITELKTNALNEVVQKLGETQAKLFDLAENVRVTRDVLTRTTIKAPLPGTIVNLRVHTVGGVISPGQVLMDIVPTDDRLIVEAKVEPNDIEVMKPGLKALVRLTAFSQKRVQPIEGRVITVSADSLREERTGKDYFLIRVEITEEIDDTLILFPGMTAEVLIITGSRTTLEYISSPILQSFGRAFREN